ncbi:calpain 7, partial [Coemansia sp. RSA 2599]
MSEAASGRHELFTRISEQVGRAVQADSESQFGAALSGYNEALRHILQLIAGSDGSEGESDGDRRPALEAKFGEYADRVSQLLHMLAPNNTYKDDLRRAQKALAKARQARQRQEIELALTLYIGGIGSYQKVLRQEKEGSGDGSPVKGSCDWARELRRFANTSLKEAENLKRTNQEPAPPAQSEVFGDGRRLVAQQEAPISGSRAGQLQQQQRRSPLPVPGTNDVDDMLESSEKARKTVSSSMATHAAARASPVERLTVEETAVVRHTSHINGLTFLPWLSNDIDENFALTSPFTDKDGLLTLSPKQRRRLWRWQRASRLCDSPTIFAQAG